MSDETLLFLLFLSIPVALVMMAACTGASQYEGAANRQEPHEEEPQRLPQGRNLREIAGSERGYIDGEYTIQDNQPVIADKRYALEDSRW